MSKGCVQLSLFSDEELKNIKVCKKRRLIALIERPNGTTYEQEIAHDRAETPWQSCLRYKYEVLGKGYWVCSWRWVYSY